MSFVKNRADLYVPKDKKAFNDGVVTVSKKERDEATHPEFLPAWDSSQKYPKILPFKHIDRGFFGDNEFKNLFEESVGPIEYVEVTPKLGAEIKSGISLSQLSPKAKDDLALLVAKRGVVILRNQDFKDKGPDFAKKWGSYYGPLHIHPTTGAPTGFPELHIVYRKSGPDDHKRAFAYRINNVGYHSDVTYELQPPGLTVFAMLQTPPSGGDTLFSDAIEAYERLSPTVQKLIDGLQVAHTSRDQANESANGGGIQRREPVDNIHPLVRWHPVLKKKMLFVQRQFSRRIVGMKQEESDALLTFLIDHIESSLDLQLRAKWEEGTVVIWDNRRVLHSATLDWDAPQTRHCFRITPQAERPVNNEEEYQNWSAEKELDAQKYIADILALAPAEAIELWEAVRK